MLVDRLITKPLWMAVALYSPSPTLAQPVVRVRAETRIELATARADRGVQVTAILRDDRGRPLRAQRMAMRLAGPSARPRSRSPSGRSRVGKTDEAGRFTATFEAARNGDRLTAVFPGGHFYQPSEVRQVLHPQQAHVALSLSVTSADGTPTRGRVNLDEPFYVVVVRAATADPAPLRVELTNELERVLKTGQLPPGGAIRWQLGPSELGPPAAGRLIARTRGDANRVAAQVELAIVRFRPTSLALDAVVEGVDGAKGEVVLRGRLADSASPLRWAAVGLFEGETHRKTVTTDAEGAFEARILVDPGDVAITARYAAAAPWHTDASAGPLRLRIPAPHRGTWPWLLFSFGVSGAVAWWLRRPSRRRVERASQARRGPGVRPARAAGRGTHRDVGGRVLDHRWEKAIAGARVVLRGGDVAHTTHTDADGHFRLSPGADGDYTLRAEHPGYEAVGATVRIPHAGDYTFADIRMQNLRHRLLGRCTRLLHELVVQGPGLPGPGLNQGALNQGALSGGVARPGLGYLTLREMADTERAPAGLRGLSQDLERAVYGVEEVSESDVIQLERRIAAVEQELQRTRH